MSKTVEQVLEQFNVLKGKREEFEKQKLALMENFRESMKEIFTDIFYVVPSIKCIEWTQYTPHFADGDECIFSLNSFNFYNFVPEDIVDMPYEAEDYSYEEGQWGFSMDTYYGNGYDRVGQKVTQAEHDILNKFFNTMHENEEFLKEVIGDHIRVVLTCNGIQTEEFEHD